MQSKSSTMLAALLIVGLIVGGGIGYFMAPSKVVTETGETVTETIEKIPLDGKTITIGNIQVAVSSLETAEPLNDLIIEPDLNEYASMLGYDVEFQIFTDQAEGQSAVELEKIQSFNSMDINLVRGGYRSSHAMGAVNYVTENNMLYWSPCATSPLLAVANDNFFRMCTSDVIQAPAIAKTMWSWGIKAIINIRRGDAWGDGIFNILRGEYTDLGGVIAEEIRYASEVAEYSSYLSIAEEKAKDLVDQYGSEHVGICLLSFSEVVTIAHQVEDYPTLWSLKWFGGDGTATKAQLRDDAPAEADHLKFLSTMFAIEPTQKWKGLYDRYFEITEMPMGTIPPMAYDIDFVMLRGVLQAQSDDSTDLVPLMIPIASDTYGMSGWNRLNEDGDRDSMNYNIFGYAVDESGNGLNAIYGYYDYKLDQVFWYKEAQTREGPVVPGLNPPGQ